MFCAHARWHAFLWKQRTEAEQLDLICSEGWTAHLGHFASILTNMGVSQQLPWSQWLLSLA